MKKKREISQGLGSARASRAGFGALAETLFRPGSLDYQREEQVRDGGGAKDSDQVTAATAPQT
jgi:hypothetical protein